MSRTRRIARLALLPLAAGTALAAASAGTAAASALPDPVSLLKPDHLVKPELYTPQPKTPCLRVYPLCLPDRSDFHPIPAHGS